MKTSRQFGSFKPQQVARTFPETAASLLLDEYLTDEEGSSARVFRVYRGTPPHYHALSDEYLYVLSGRGTFWMDEPANAEQFGPGDLLFFKKRTVHALPGMLEEPIVFLAIDVPRREPTDVIFVESGDGSRESFIGRVNDGVEGR